METKRPIKILITGGHFTPAIAVIEQIQKEYPDWEIVFAGRKYALEADSEPSEEYRTIQKLGIRFLPVVTARLQRAMTFSGIVSLCKLPIGLLQSFLYCAHEKPSLVLSFGGYVAVPVAIVAKFFGIPVVTHEQTRIVGLANKIIGLVALRIYTSVEHTIGIGSSKKVLYTGLPMRNALFMAPREPFVAADKKFPLLYITGGSTGAMSFNAIVFSALLDLLSGYTVVHQTGRNSHAAALSVFEKLPQEMRSRYIVRPFFEVDELSSILKSARIVIGRSGANTVAELEALGKIAIFVPLPHSANDEQQKNAKALEDNGSAIIIEQKDLTRNVLVDMIQEVEKKYSTLNGQALERAAHVPKDAARRIVSDIAALVVT